MAEEKKMELKVNKDIVYSDRFIDMSAESKTLYFYLLMGADADGKVRDARAIARSIWLLEEDEDALEMLVKEKYLTREDDVYIVAR